MKGLCKLMNTENVIGPINIGNDNEMTIIELCDTLYKLIPNTKSNKIYQELPSDDPKKRKPDLTRARELLKMGTTNKFRNRIKKYNRIF